MKLTPAIISELPAKYDDRAATISQLPPEKSTGEVYKIEIVGDTRGYYYLMGGSALKPTDDQPYNCKLELVKGSLLKFGGIKSKVLTVKAGEPIGIDPVAIDTIVKYENEYVKSPEVELLRKIGEYETDKANDAKLFVNALLETEKDTIAPPKAPNKPEKPKKARIQTELQKEKSAKAADPYEPFNYKI
jgi:hypothetical protein